jgi:hypothetical protein
MFLQVIQAKVADEAGVRSALERWQHELMGGAEGFLGATFGFLDDGSLLNIARFESAVAARRNSERAEQGEWAAELTKSLAGEPTYIDVPEADLWLGGGSDDAGFVQVMVGHSSDVDRLLQQGQEVDEAQLREGRPEIIGGIQGKFGDDGYVFAAYFRNEEAARSGEAQEPPEDVREMLEERMRLMGEVQYYDLRQPRMISKS